MLAGVTCFDPILDGFSIQHYKVWSLLPRQALSQFDSPKSDAAGANSNALCV